jgi:Ni,Fe-hydrogenase maturation factor
MKVYVFGNQDFEGDNKAIIAAKKLAKDFSNINFVFVKPNEDLPFADQKTVYILDNVVGIEEPIFLTEEDLDKCALSRFTSVHDFDLAFQLKYLKKLGKLGKITILGIPAERSIAYSLISSSFKKLVAQDMQGS